MPRAGPSAVAERLSNRLPAAEDRDLTEQDHGVDEARRRDPDLNIRLPVRDRDGGEHQTVVLDIGSRTTV
ncbi:hypothetical protein [Methylorubrum sp. SB2]|uniref:hypothetical protein n=1 Tax=Methylorubrum subtropicum TaxID=3138812 RepID=UPI00313D419E